MDAGYGCNTDLRTGVSALGLSYVAGILPNTSVWTLGTGPLPPKKWSGQGRPPKLIRRDDKHRPISVKQLALDLPKRARMAWHVNIGASSASRTTARSRREGTTERLSSRFARVRVRAAHRDYNLTDSRPEEWLLIEWLKGRGRTDQILALNASAKHHLPLAGGPTPYPQLHRDYAPAINR